MCPGEKIVFALLYTHLGENLINPCNVDFNIPFGPFVKIPMASDDIIHSSHLLGHGCHGVLRPARQKHILQSIYRLGRTALVRETLQVKRQVCE